jgi:hypothetical protein
LNIFIARKEEILINENVPIEELEKRIKYIEKDIRVLKRLYFILYRYRGYSVKCYNKDSRSNKNGRISLAGCMEQ